MAKGSVRKKGKKWYYRFYVEDASGKMIQKEYAGTVSKSETEKLLRKALEDYENKKFVAKADSLTVGETYNPGQSRMTIVVSGDEYILDQITKQLAKLVERTAPEAADVRQWNDTLAYVTGRPSCASAEEARALLLTLLSQA